MKHRLVMLGLAAIVAGSLSACGGSDSSAVATTPPPPPSSNQGLDTAQVLAQSRASSESSDPYAVNSGVVYLSDTLDTTDAAYVNGA